MLASHCGSSNRRVEAFLKAGHASFADGPVNFQQEPCLTQHLASLKICDVQLSSQVFWPRSAVCRRDGRPLRHLIICNSRLTLSLLYIYSQSTSKAHLWQRLQDALSVPALLASGIRATSRCMGQPGVFARGRVYFHICIQKIFYFFFF